ncbi:beta-ketoacyl synthase N-terminal-like domain-containing protein [Streptomyces sp. NPDC054887]
MSERPTAAKSIRSAVVERLCADYGMAPHDIADDTPFAEYGVTSRDAIALTGELSALTGATLAPTLLWEYPTLGQVVRHLSEKIHTASPEGDLHQESTSLDEPIAVVGIGCRLPGGVHSPADFWRVLREGRDVVSTVPEGRWRSFDAGGDTQVTGVSRHGGYLDDIAGFDADFFGITPREALAMDPQQRFLLEVSREALDHAAIPVRDIAGTRTGVFVGISTAEYAQLTAQRPETVHAWTASGVALSMAANRLSYVLDAKGPSMALDTACSSSLVAVHQAVRSLVTGESDTALACGVNLLLAPATTRALQETGTMSPTGRCRAFDGTADGMVRGEGCVVVVLKRLADAERSGARVLAVIRSSAVNSDGRSNGLLAPDAAAQRALLHEAHHIRGPVAPSHVDYIEAHGTGTPVGDLIEAGSLSAVLGQDRDMDRPLLIGSVKSNTGHLEAAAGITGLVKTVLALAHDEIPRSLHYSVPNRHLDVAEAGLSVVSATRPWPRYSGRATAGVSAFGMGGTNAHVVLQEHQSATPAAGTRDATVPAPSVLLLDAPTAWQLNAQADSLAQWFAVGRGRHTVLSDVARTLAGRVGRGTARAAVVAHDNEQAATALQRLSAGQSSPRIVRGAADLTGGLVWIFPGYGAQWPGMGKRLLETEPAFAAEITRLEPLIAEHCGFGLRAFLQADTDFGGPEVAQPVLFAVQMALAGLWRSYGVHPTAVIGHSMGEVAAAAAAGALDLDDAVRVIATRSRLLAGLSGGAMAVVDLPGEAVREFVPDGAGIHVSAYGSPTQCVVGGPVQDVRSFAERLGRQGRTVRLVPVGVAGHTPSVEPLLEDLQARLAALRARRPHTTMYSTTDEDVLKDPHCDASYWAANMRRPVRFADAVQAAVRDGGRTFVELSPHPTQTSVVLENLRALDIHDALVIPSMRKDTDNAETFRTSLASLITCGVEVSPEALAPRGHVVDVPLPRWRHQRFWPVAPDRDGPHSSGKGAPEERQPSAIRAIPGSPPHDEQVLPQLHRLVASITGYSPDRLDVDAPLTQLGLDSLLAKRIQAAIMRTFDKELPASLLTRGASLRETAAHLERPRTASAGPDRPAVAPRDEAERLVLHTWNTVAGSEPRETDIRVVPALLRTEPEAMERFAATLSTRLGTSISRRELWLTGGSLAEIATVVRPRIQHGSVGCLRTLRSAGTEAPLYLVHPAGGTSSVYQSLADRLKPGRPCFGLDRFDDVVDVEARAQRYAEVITARHPQGPCVIGGWSYGGVVAQETARLLSEGGVRVEAVVLIDSILPLPAPGLSPHDEAVRRYAGFAHYVEQTYGKRLTLDYDLLAALNDTEQVRVIADALAELNALPPAVLTHQRDSAIDLRSGERHTPRPYGGRTLLYRASEPAPHTVREMRYERSESCLGWSAYCRNLAVVDVPGHHLEVLDPPAVDVLAERLRRDLASSHVDQGRGGPRP